MPPAGGWKACRGPTRLRGVSSSPAKFPRVSECAARSGRSQAEFFRAQGKPAARSFPDTSTPRRVQNERPCSGGKCEELIQGLRQGWPLAGTLLQKAIDLRPCGNSFVENRIGALLICADSDQILGAHVSRNQQP